MKADDILLLAILSSILQFSYLRKYTSLFKYAKQLHTFMNVSLRYVTWISSLPTFW